MYIIMLIITVIRMHSKSRKVEGSNHENMHNKFYRKRIHVIELQYKPQKLVTVCWVLLELDGLMGCFVIKI